jgi:hypothetical protein
MKKVFLFLILLSFANISAQENPQWEVNKISKPDFKFSDLNNSNDLFSFRFWNQGQVIELRILSDSTRKGTITNFVTKAYKSWRKQEKIRSGKIDEKVFFQEIDLTENQFSKILNLIKTSKITDLPSDEELKEWKPVLDGEWFKIEQNLDGKYKSKSYGNPKQQNDLKEAVKFLNFYSSLNEELELKTKFSYFFSDLKYGCYSKNGEHQIICKKRN